MTQKPTNIDIVDKPILTDKPRSKLPIGISTVGNIVQNSLGNIVQHVIADAGLTLDMLEKHVVDALGVVCETTHDIRLVLDCENVVVICAELLEVCGLVHF